MNNALKALKQYHQEKKYEWTPGSVLETLQECCNKVHHEFSSSHREFDIYLHVVELNGILIGYLNEYSTGDNETGYEFDINSICEMKMVTTYRKIK